MYIIFASRSANAVRQTPTMACPHVVMSVGYLVWHRPFHRLAAIQLEDLRDIGCPHKGPLNAQRRDQQRLQTFHRGLACTPVSNCAPADTATPFKYD
jgi:hypothetical protein